jgi:hypothetical protein
VGAQADGVIAEKTAVLAGVFDGAFDSTFDGAFCCLTPEFLTIGCIRRGVGGVTGHVSTLFLYLEGIFMSVLIPILLMTASPVAAAAANAPAAAQPVDLAAARASLTGQWAGTLEYLDYTANEWFGIPVKTLVEDQGDGATTIRKSDFDDGPKVGNVRITSVELFDAAAGTLVTGTFRKGKPSSLETYAVRLDTASDATHWTMIEEVKADDDDRPAMLRLTTVRDGDTLETLKQVDFLDDAKDEWLSRNRVRLKRVAG